MVDPERTHLITGGLGGFGLATASWLVDRGARHLVLVGRSGAANPSAREAVENLRQRGADVRVEALDIADGAAVAALFADIAGAMPPLGGVVHAAMALGDATIANLEGEKLRQVLRPKIAGAEILDAQSRNLDLDYFLLFSSATTIFGSPGQGAYVAANGYLEGLARRRREAGLPALAVAWGVIADVGVLAARNAAREALEARVGVKGVDARAALDLMAEASARPDGARDDGMVGVADVNWTVARSQLRALAAPTYSRLAGEPSAGEAPKRGAIDLRALRASMPHEEARRAVAEIVTEEVARVLRMPREDVSKTERLSEIGLDSLMAVELTFSLEERFGLDAPLGRTAGALGIFDLAEHLLLSCGDERSTFHVAESLAEQHLDSAERTGAPDLIAALQERGVAVGDAPRGQ